MSHYSEEDLCRLIDELHGIRKKSDELVLKFLVFNYATLKGREFACHGFVRRVRLLIQSIEDIYALIPPNSTAFPSQRTLQTVTLLMQANVMNVAGAIDNLAWIWVSEQSITKSNGRELPRSQVGLGPGNEIIRSSFSVGYKEFLADFDEWFGYHDGFRDAFAHRIPLYIPPYVVDRSNEAEAIKAKMAAAELAKDYDLHFNLGEKLKRHAKFLPYMAHSLNELNRAIVVHPQLLADFLTLTEIGLGLMKEMEAARGLVPDDVETDL